MEVIDEKKLIIVVSYFKDRSHEQGGGDN